MAKKLDAVFAALSDPTRRAIMVRLKRGSALVTELARPFAMSLPAVSKHLRILEAAGLIRRKKIGREVHCTAVVRPLGVAVRWTGKIAS